jgi:hypothetical protein
MHAHVVIVGLLVERYILMAAIAVSRCDDAPIIILDFLHVLVDLLSNIRGVDDLTRQLCQLPCKVDGGHCLPATTPTACKLAPATTTTTLTPCLVHGLAPDQQQQMGPRPSRRP